MSMELQTLTLTVERGEEENKLLHQQVNVQGGRMEELERYTRRDNLIISGLPEGSYLEASSNAANSSNDIPESSQSTEKTVLKLFTESMGLNLTPSDITIAHRLKKGGKDIHRPIIVRLVNKRVRDCILRAKKTLRNSDGFTSVFISEHLTQSASSLLFDARRLVCQKKIASAWTMNGRVFYKVKLEDKLGIMIKSVNDLPN